MGAAASFDRRVTRRVSVGTHEVVFCEVECVQYAEDAESPMYFRVVITKLSS
jgi:flavin reductase